ncbi:MAG: magnesium transporter [Candidatus Aenigmarchaeota archaeon]|nr:magnesium transporter [Candidatus Aenigmarchaeota archaeon]
MGFFTKDFKEIFYTQIISVTGGLLAGTLLAVYLNKIYLIPGFFILFPGLMDMRGSISGSLAARLSAGLHLGAIKPAKMVSEITIGNFKAALLLTVIVSLLLGTVAYIVNLIIFSIDYPRIILISVFAALMANLVEVPMTILITFWLFRKGHDPNNIMGPYVSTSGDIVTVVSLLIAIVVV